jgi:hypothetical protein
MKNYILIFFLGVLLIACGKTKDCEIGGLDLKITNMTPGENDTITVFWYKKGDGFTEVVYTNQMIFADSLDSINGVTDNTIFLSEWQSRVGHVGYLRGDYDYRILTRSNEYYFSEIFAPYKSQKCPVFPGCPVCISSVTSFTLNGENFDKTDTEPIELVN